jgi:hypothetical protein
VDDLNRSVEFAIRMVPGQPAEWIPESENFGVSERR